MTVGHFYAMALENTLNKTICTVGTFNFPRIGKKKTLLQHIAIFPLISMCYSKEAIVAHAALPANSHC